jgi:hypothetical protein
MDANKQKLTPFFKDGVNPVHPGVYEIDKADHDGRAFSHWDGRTWGLATWEKPDGGFQDAINKAVEADRVHVGLLTRSWRGFTEPQHQMTNWFPAGTKPSYVGVYEVEDDYGQSCYAFWRGDGWGYASWKPGQDGVKACANDDLRLAKGTCWIDDCRWRGLAVQP